MKRARRHFGSVITRPGRAGYYVRVRWAGVQRIRYSGPTKTVANEHLSQIHAALARGGNLDDVLAHVLGPTKDTVGSTTPVAAPARPTFAEVTERYMRSIANEKRESTLLGYRTMLTVVLTAPWASTPIDEIGRGQIAGWLDEIGATRKEAVGLAPSTLNRYRSVISGIFTYAVEHELVTANPVSGVRTRDESGRQREEYLTADECRAFMAHCPPELHLMIALDVMTGLRQGVMRELRWRDLDLDAGKMRVRASIAKGKKPQDFPLLPYVVDRLRAMHAAQGGEEGNGDRAVFRTKTGRPWSKSRLCQLVRAAVDSCPGIREEKRKAISFHSLRHSYGTLLAEDDFSGPKLKEAMSHSDPRLTARYSHVGSKATREAVERMGRILRLDEPDEVREGYHRGYQAPRAS